MADSKADRAAFVRRFGGIYEHSPWVAEQAFEQAAGIVDPERLATIFADCADRADQDTKLTLIRAHPDLAGRAAIDNGPEVLTAESSEEQASAGIDCCTLEEFARFHELNRRYKAKFGFPFIMAVRGSNRQEILRAFAVRLDNDADKEFATAMKEIHKIAKLRLQANAR